MSVMPEKFQVLCLKNGVSSAIGSFLKFIFHEEARTIEIALIVWGSLLDFPHHYLKGRYPNPDPGIFGNIITPCIITQFK